MQSISEKTCELLRKAHTGDSFSIQGKTFKVIYSFFQEDDYPADTYVVLAICLGALVRFEIICTAYWGEGDWYYTYECETRVLSNFIFKEDRFFLGELEELEFPL